MTTIQFVPAKRAMLKRLIGKSSVVLINTNGDLTNYDTYIQLTDEPRGTWHELKPYDLRQLLKADEITITDEGISILTGVRTTHITLEPLAESDDVPLFIMEPDAETVIIHTRDNHNLEAMKVLAATASKDDTLPALTAVFIDGNKGGKKAVTAGSTDRYQATLATLEASPGDVTALIPGSLVNEIPRRREWGICISEDYTTVEFYDLDVTVTGLNLQDVSYPPIEKLFDVELENGHTLTARPKDIAEAIKSLSAARNEAAVITKDGTTFAHGTPEVEIPGAEVTLGHLGSETIGFNPTFPTKQFTAIGARWEKVSITWREKDKPMSINYGHNITGLLMPLRNDLVRPNAKSTEDAKEAA